MSSGWKIASSYIIGQGHISKNMPCQDRTCKLVDKKFLKHTYAYMSKRGAIKLEYGDVVLGKFEPQERIY